MASAVGSLLLHAIDGPVGVLVDRASASRDVVRLLAASGFEGQVRLIEVNGRASRAVEVLKTMPRLGAIVDLTRSGSRDRLLTQTIWAIEAGGHYVAPAVPKAWRSQIEDAARAHDDDAVAASRRRRELRDAIDDIGQETGAAVVRKRGTHHAVVRHHEVEDVMTARFGDDWGRVLASRPAYSFESQAGLVMHGRPAPRDKPRHIDVPALAIREYHDVTCHVREIVTRDNLILPDTYRHWQDHHLFHKRIHQATTSFGRLQDDIASADVRRAPGAYFSFDSAFPHHFGHLMTETVSRAWGWREASARIPDLKVVMTRLDGKPALAPWKADVLQALGVRTDEILWVSAGQSVQVDSLVAAMPQLENPRYIDRGIATTWAQIYEALGPDPHRSSRSEKIFLSRSASGQRVCSNIAAVERFMAERGFAVIHPETLSFAEQAHTAGAAKIVAGFAGSALLTTMFNPQAKIVILSSDSYVAANEYLVASANGNEIHYFWAPAAVGQPTTGLSTEAYRSGFEFPLAEHHDELIDVLT